jgi:lauroyl/myristoyl acyltransferase
MNNFLTEYRRFFERLYWVSRCGYNRITRSFSGNLAFLFHTRRASLPTVAHNLQSYLGLEASRARTLSRQWLENLGVSALNIFFYRNMTRSWVEQHVEVSDSDLLNEMVCSGGLLLTYHTHHHHNTVGCVLGLLGARILGLSAAKNPEFDHAEIRKFHIDIMHDESEKNFGGGHYLYLKDPIKAMRDAKQGMGDGSLVVGLADLPSPLKKNIWVDFLGHPLSVQRWLFDLAEKTQTPLYFCLLASQNLKSKKPLYLSLGRSHAKDAMNMAQDYFRFLEKQMHVSPSAWQGWEWVQVMAAAVKSSI